MNKKPAFEISIDLRITDHADQYSTKTVAKFDLSEAVPDGVDPADHLRNLIKANFARVFGSLQLVDTEEIT